MRKKIIIVVAMILVVVLMLGKGLIFHEHNFDGWATIKEATEQSEGLQRRKCKDCGDTEDRIIPKIIHEHEFDEEKDYDYIKMPTCQSQGIGRMYCLTCGEAVDNYFSDPNAHTYTEWEPVLNEGSTEALKDKRSCTLCSFVEERDHVHELGNFTVLEEATCAKDGKLSTTCLTCGYVEENIIPTNENHVYSTKWNIKQEATDTQLMIIENKCTVCEKTIQMEHEHVLEDIIVQKPATCTENGLLIDRCTICVYESEVTIPASGHLYEKVEIKKEPTCIENGIKVSTCSKCGYVLEEEIKSTGIEHKWGTWVEKVPSTDDSPEIIERECELCHKTEQKENNIQ